MLNGCGVAVQQFGRAAIPGMILSDFEYYLSEIEDNWQRVWAWLRSKERLGSTHLDGVVRSATQLHGSQAPKECSLHFRCIMLCGVHCSGTKPQQWQRRRQCARKLLRLTHPSMSCARVATFTAQTIALVRAAAHVKCIVTP